MNRWLKRGLWALAALPVVLVLTWYLLSRYGSSRLEDTLARLRERGYATSLAEMAPPAIPDEDNGAPLFIKAFELLPADNDIAFFHKLRTEKLSALTPEEQEKIRKILADLKPMFRIVDDARTKKGCRFDRDYSKGFLLQVDWMIESTTLATLLAARADVAQQEGRPGEARSSVASAFAVGEIYADEPLLLCQMIRISILHIALEVMERCVTADTPADELRAWLEILPSQDALDGLTERSLRGELAGAAQMAVETSGLSTLQSTTPQPTPSTRDGIMKGFLDYSFSRHLDRMEQVVTSAGKPYPQAHTELEAMTTETEELGPLDMISGLMLPGTVTSLDQQTKAQARLAILRAGLEFEIERAEKGAYPAKVKTVDPFTGAPLLYDAKEGTIGTAGPPAGSTNVTVAPWTLRHPPKK